jgi:hypothetical protein
VLGVGSVVAGLLGLLLGWLLMFLAVVPVVLFSCWLCCCRASWATVGPIVDVPCRCLCCVCVLGVGSVVAGLLGLLLGWLVMFLVGVYARCFDCWLCCCRALGLLLGWLLVCIVVVSVLCFSCWLCCCRASWAAVGLIVDVPRCCRRCVFQLLALLLQGFLGYCWAGC